ncbi:hypothetical protein MKW92_012475 [Papaver armeniacum]|nr:hypothetical protein MKW92_012475 [Papaver armeniacum]
MRASYVLVKFQCFILLLLRLVVASAETSTNVYRPIAKPGCQDRCGNVSIPYPFGIGEGCFIGDSFELTCSNNEFYFTKPMLGKLNVSKISIPDGHMTTSVYISTYCSDEKTKKWRKTESSTFIGKKFTFSSTKNKFIAMGCNTYAELKLADNFHEEIYYRSLACTSFCNAVEDTTDGSCAGIGCCELSIPPGLAVYDANVSSLYEPRTHLSFNPCSYAFLIEESSFNFSSSYLKDFNNNGSGMVPVVIDWTVGNVACEEARRNQTSYACGPNSYCITGQNAPGYRCMCRKGYEGNPYLNGSSGGECRGIC